MVEKVGAQIAIWRVSNWKTLAVSPSVEGYLFQIREG